MLGTLSSQKKKKIWVGYFFFLLRQMITRRWSGHSCLRLRTLGLLYQCRWYYISPWRELLHLNYDDNEVAKFIFCLQSFEVQKRCQERAISTWPVGARKRTSSFRVLSKVDLDVLVRRWKFSTTIDRRVNFWSVLFSVNFGLTLACRWNDVPHCVVAAWL